jgi:hypothetical protein
MTETLRSFGIRSGRNFRRLLMSHLTTMNPPADATKSDGDGIARAGTLAVVVASLVAILVLIL